MGDGARGTGKDEVLSDTTVSAVKFRRKQRPSPDSGTI